VGIAIENCVANVFNLASKMSEAHNSLTAKRTNIIPHHIQTWYYAHALNLVICNAALILPSTILFFGFLNEAEVFLKDSLTMLHMYTEENSV